MIAEAGDGGLPSLMNYIDQYCQGVGLQDIPNWDFYVAFVHFRGGAILQGVYKRFTQGMGGKGWQGDCPQGGG